MMKRFLIRACVFVLIAYGASVVLSWGYTELFARYKPDRGKKNWILIRKGDTCDYAAIGSSRIFHMLDVPLLNELTGKKGINIATSGSSYADNYVLLIKYLQRNKIRNLILNIDELCFHSSTSYTYGFKDLEFMPYFFEDTIHEVYRDNEEAWKFYLWKTVPLSRYIEFNAEYELGSLLWANTRHIDCKYDTTCGTELLYNMKYKKFSKDDTTQVTHNTMKIDPKDLRYFYKILSLCQSKGIQLILITPPLYEKGIYTKENRQKIQHYIEELAKKEGLVYLNFYDVEKLQNKYYFRDMTHTNILGTRLFTRYLAPRLKNHL